MNPQRILVVEDEPDIREVLRYNLEREGFSVVCAADGVEALRAVGRELPDLILLDLLLPGIDGIEVCRKLKMDASARDTPIIMVTAKGGESDVVLGLGVGADDFVTKPFSPRELIARVRAVLRRATLEPEDSSPDKLVRPGLVIDPMRHEVQVDGETISLTATQFRLLHLLASSPGRVWTREQLVTRVIGQGATVIDRNIDVHIGAIRRKLGGRQGLLETVRGVGYRFHDEPPD